MTIDGATFRSVLGRFATGVTVITARDEAGDHGMTASAFCSLSLSPPMVLVCVAHDATIHPVVERESHFAINVLTASQETLARRFAEKLGDRFVGVGFTRALTGAPILDDVLAILECRIVDRLPGGDHTILIGEVLAAQAAGTEQPLVYYRGGYAQLER